MIIRIYDNIQMGDMQEYDICKKDSINITKNVSPLRYPGGKTRACKILDSILSEHYDIAKFTRVISPFFGGGSFEFYLQNKYNLRIIANDKFKPLYNFWCICKSDQSGLCEMLCEHIGKVDSKLFSSFREKILNETDVLTQGFMYFVINRCSFSGATLSGGFSQEASAKRFTPSSIEKIAQLDLARVSMHNLDFEEFICANATGDDNDDALLFLDPPYYLEKRSKLYGRDGDLHEAFDHARLYACISKRKNWIMTYNNCEYIKKLYKDFKIVEVKWSYGMNKTKTSSEIVIIGPNHK